jgi:hypothetical protein
VAKKGYFFREIPKKKVLYIHLVLFLLDSTLVRDSKAKILELLVKHMNGNNFPKMNIRRRKKKWRIFERSRNSLKTNYKDNAEYQNFEYKLRINLVIGKKYKIFERY